MNINKINFFSLLDRMEKKGTLNESIKNRRIITEGIGNITKYVKKFILNVDDIQLKLSKYNGNKPFKINNDTDSFATSVNNGVEKLANQIKKLSSGENVKQFIKSSTIEKGFDLFIDSFVDGDLKRLGILQDSSPAEILKLKRFLKNGDTLPQSLFKYDVIVNDVLIPLRQQHLATKKFTMLGNTMSQLINSNDIIDIILGLMKRDGDYYSDLNLTIKNIVNINEYVNMKFPEGTKTVDGVDIGGQYMFPEFQTSWNGLMSDIGKKNGIGELEKNLTPKTIKKIITQELKNKSEVNTYQIKQRNKVSEFIKRKKMKNIPKTVRQKFGGKITEADLQDAIIIKTKDGMDVFVPKNEKSKSQLTKFLKNNGIKHEGWVDSIFLGGKNTDGGKDLAQINKRMKISFWTLYALPILTYSGIVTYMFNYCTSLQGEDKIHSEDELEYLKGKGVVQDEWFDRVISCGVKALSFFYNYTEVLAEKLWNGTIKGEFLLIEKAITEEIDKRCEEYKTTNGVDCCNINCEDTSEEPMMITIDGKSQNVSGVVKNILNRGAIKDWANKNGISIGEVIQKFDTENMLDGAFTEDGNDINVKGIIKKICNNTVNSDKNVNCITTHLQKTWDEFLDFKGLGASNCNYDGVKNHINDKIDELKKYEYLIEFSEEKVPGKFIIKQENLNGLLQQALTGKKIEDLDTLRGGYNKIVDTLVKECSTEGNGKPVESKEEGSMELGEMTVIYKTLKDMVMALYDQGEWGTDCDVYGEMTEEAIKDQMFYLFLNYAETGTISDSSSFYGQVDVAFNWWYPKYKDLCGEGDVTPVNPVVPDEDEDVDIDYDEDGNIIKN